MHVLFYDDAYDVKKVLGVRMGVVMGVVFNKNKCLLKRS
jgi:hypothetical protein